MSEENKTNKEQSGFVELSDDEINASSVFSKPHIEHKPQKAKPRMGIALKTILALAIVAVLIASTLIINKLFGKQSGSSELSVESAVVSSGMADYSIKLTDYTADDVKSISLKNANGEFEFYPVDNSGSLLWYIKGIDKKYINTTLTDLTVGDCVTPKASISRAFEEGYDYGFENPAAEFTVTLKSGKNFSVTMSETYQNGGITGAYLKCTLNPQEVYILSGEATEYYTREMVYYINQYAPTKIEETKENAEYFDGSIPKVDYVKFWGRYSKEEYRFEMSERENSTIDYVMVSPYEYPANTERVSNALSFVTEDIEAAEIYYFDKDGISDKVLKEYSLDDPDLVIKYKVASDEVTIKASQSKTDKVYYAVTVNDGPVIYKVSIRNFDFLEQDASYFAAESVLLENIGGLSEMRFHMGDKNYNFNITSKENENEELEVTVKYDGKTIDTENYSNYYSYLLVVNPVVSENSILQSRPEGAQEYFSVDFIHNNKTSDSDLTFTIFKLKDNEARYYIEMNGKPMGLCLTEYADVVYEKIEDVIANKEIEAMN